MGYITDHAEEANKIRFRLLAISFAPDPFFATDCEIPVDYDGNRYEPRGFSVSEIQNQQSGPMCTLSVPDADNELFMLLDASNGGESMPLTIFTAEFDPANYTTVPDDVIVAFTGSIATASKETGDGADRVEIWCGPPKQTTACLFPTRLISGLIRHAT